MEQDKDDIVLQTNFREYQNCDDVTTVSGNILVPPSQNVLITGVQQRCIESRAGYSLLGRARTQTGYGIRSWYDDFVNNIGVKLPIREFGLIAGDSKMEVFYNNDWQPLFGNQNAPHEFYFTEFYDDTTLLPILVMVGGTDQVNYWNGGISIVTSTTATTVSIQDQIIPLGFTPTGTFYIGTTVYSYTGFSGNQFTGVTPNPTGTTGGILTQPIITTQLQRLGQTLSNIPTLDIVTTLDNHVIYGSYQSRTLYFSNTLQKTAQANFTTVSTNLNDITISGTYSGTTDDTIKIEIDTVPPSPVYTYSVITAGDSTDVTFTGTYSGPGRSQYSVTIDGAGTYAWFLNGALQAFAQAIPVNPGTSVLLANGISVVFGSGTAGQYTVGNAFNLSIGNAANGTNGGDTYRWYLNGVVQASGVPTSSPLIYNGVTFTFGSYVGHTLGSYWEIQVLPAIVLPFADVYYGVPNRLPGQGGTPKLDSPPVSLNVQERFCEATSRNGIFTVFNFTLSSDLLTEAITQQNQKTTPTNKIIRQSLTFNTKNKLAFINVENQLARLGRVQDIFGEQTVEIVSRKVQNDFTKAPFVVNTDGNGNGSIGYADNKIWVTCPALSKTWFYEDLPELEFWQAPMIGSFSHISVINGQVCAHSAISDETYVLFSASNDNGYPFTAIASFPYISSAFNNYTQAPITFERRDVMKEYQTLFVEAYKTNNTNMYAHINFDFGGCTDIKEFLLDPIVCTPSDRASLGKGKLGLHGLGNDPVPQYTKFRHTNSLGVKNCYEAQVIFFTNNIDNYFKLVSFGLNATLSDNRNVVINLPGQSVVVPTGTGIANTPMVSPNAGGSNTTAIVADASSGTNSN